MFIIECFSGKDIRQHSYFRDEAEILLTPGRQFEVVSYLKQGPDFYSIQLKETESKFPLLESVSHDVNRSVSRQFQSLFIIECSRKD